MASAPFDVSKAVTFDLSRGQIQKDDQSRVLVPASALVALCQGAGSDATAAFATAIGESMGLAIAARFEGAGSDVKNAPLDAIVEHLAGELAVTGFGTLSIERWGQALVVVVDGGLSSVEGDRLLAPLLAAAVARSAHVEARCVALGRDGARARFLVTGQRGADKAREWLGSGVGWGEVLVRLHAPAGNA
ncbi:MAG TPA: hypothetical protein VJT73_01185 [Polyangiaceae bacterium]|nr:hypothetical protein [Polyangiaceae bacterium]